MKTNDSIQSVLWICLLIMGLGIVSCSVDEEIENPNPGKPVITFDEESGIYTVKTGRSITLKAIVENAQNPVYSWKLDGKLVATDLTHTHEAQETGEFYYTFDVDASNGSVQEEILVNVVDKTPPAISLPVPEEGYLTAIKGVELKLAPLVKFHEGATYEWIMDKKTVATDSVYVFKEDALGDYTLTLNATNEDGATTLDVWVKVTEAPTLSISFEKEVMTAPTGKMVMVVPFITYQTDNVFYEWSLDGEIQLGQRTAYFSFTPITEKEYLVTVTGRDGEITVTQSVRVVCVAGEGTYKREKTANSSPYSTNVFEFLPAPGQFVNESYQAYTMEEACEYARKRLENVNYVSLGGFGGYVVVGFDHSIDNVKGEYDFAIYGNAFSGSSEPGIVWVMQDENGDGLPNDTWYELRGSETGKSSTIQNYAVTYYKPSAPEMDVQWTDNLGNSGTIDYWKVYHSQSYYYPNWVTAKSYTLRGTCLKAKNTVNNGIWVNDSYEWGYADNFGSDTDGSNNKDADALANYFKIDHAMYPDGTPADLKYIDFIKVQTGVNAKSGWLGEISTEVFRFEDIY